jgi:hypothetical protein
MLWRMADAPSSRPRPGVDYPRDRIEFSTFFPDDAACAAYLERLRWPDGFQCAHCQKGDPAWRSKRGLWVCGTCRRQVSVTAGTIFEGTRKLQQWLLAAWDVTSQKYGASALGLKRTLGLGSYETAWAWLQKLRKAMVRPDRDQLGGDVEVDETYIGGTEPGPGGRWTAKKSIVMVLVEMNGGRIGRIRLRRVPNFSADSLQGVISELVRPSSLVHTAGRDTPSSRTRASATASQ